MSEGDRGYRPEIDGLRAIAVMAVILFHVGLGPFTGGYVGVDVFFVISGYLIVGIVWRQCEKGQFRLGEFYRRRVLRLFPALLLVCVATMAVSVVVLLPSDFMRLGRSLAATMGYVSNIWLWRNTGYFDARAETLPLLHTWSLSVEEQFYMVFPVALLLLHRHLRARAVAVLVTLGVLTLAATQYFLVSRQSAVFYLTPFRAWEFLLGGVLAVTATAPRAAWLRSVARWTALALVLAPVFVYDSHTDFPGLTAVAPCVGAALLLISVGPDDRDVVSRALRSRPFVLVGKLSYSLYLWHWPVLVLWTHADQRPESPLAMAAVMVITFSLSAISYRLVETPLRQADAPYAGRVLWGSLAASVALAVVALVVGVGDGVPSRFSEPVVALDRARFPDVPFTPCFGPALVGGDCTLGVSTAAPRWLLWGDSHALALAPALDATLKKRGEAAVFIAGSACPPLWGVGSRDVRSGDWRVRRAGRARRCSASDWWEHRRGHPRRDLARLLQRERLPTPRRRRRARQRGGHGGRAARHARSTEPARPSNHRCRPRTSAPFRRSVRNGSSRSRRTSVVAGCHRGRGADGAGSVCGHAGLTLESRWLRACRPGGPLLRVGRVSVLGRRTPALQRRPPPQSRGRDRGDGARGGGDGSQSEGAR